MKFFKNRSLEKDFAKMHKAFLRDDYEGAEEIGNKILDEDPDHTKTQLLIAQMARNQEHYKKARERYNKVVLAHPTHSEGRLGRAKSSYELFNFEDALDDYLTLYETSFRYTDYLVALGDTYQKLNLHVIALRYYDKATHQSPDHIKAHVGLGYQYLIMGFYKKAKEEAETAKDLYYKHKYEYDTNVVDNIFGLEEQVSLLTGEEEEEEDTKQSPVKKKTTSSKTSTKSKKKSKTKK